MRRIMFKNQQDSENNPPSDNLHPKLQRPKTKYVYIKLSNHLVILVYYKVRSVHCSTLGLLYPEA